MKTKRKLNISSVFTNLSLSILVGYVFHVTVGVDPIIPTAVVFGAGTGLQFLGMELPKGAFMAGVYREIWTGELVESFKPHLEASFLNEIKDYSEKVSQSKGGEYEFIHLVDIGADPEVLINNNTYPIGYTELEDGDIAFKLDTYDTKATRVTADELYAISYDKVAKVNGTHKDAILGAKFGKGTHALAPMTDTSNTPVILTTGVTEAGKKRASKADIIRTARAMTVAGIPNDGRRVLILDEWHLYDLLLEDDRFYDKYVNIEAGTVKARFYGFKVYTYSNNPFYAGTAKASYGTVFDEDVHNRASVAFYAPDMFKCTGSTIMYYDEPDTQYHASAVNFTHRYLVSPKKARGVAALVTANE